mgnify:CR=1 FL=1
MGQNSTEVSYGFGQMGSAHTDLAAQVRPPKGMVIVAIQFLAANILSELTAEVPRVGGAEYVGTLVAANDTGDTTATCAGTGNDTELVMSAVNPDVKVGMIIESQSDADIPYSLTAPTTVTAIAADGITLTMSKAIAVSSQTCGFFSPRGSGFGGIQLSGVNFPTGIVIYGRWTSVTPAVDTDGGIICYFGH